MFAERIMDLHDKNRSVEYQPFCSCLFCYGEQKRLANKPKSELNLRRNLVNMKRSKQFSRVGGLRSEAKRVTTESRKAFQHRGYGHKSTGGTNSLFKKIGLA